MRRIIPLLLVVLCVTFLPSLSQAKSTINPDDLGYEKDGGVWKNEWIDYKTPCKKCEDLTKAYNNLMNSLFELEYRAAKSKEMVENVSAFTKNSQDTIKTTGAEKSGLFTSKEELAASRLSISMALEGLRHDTIPALEKKVKTLRKLAKEMRAQIAGCENQCSTQESNLDGAIGPVSTSAYDLPFAWKGPYPENCEACRKIAGQLNKLPTLAFDAIANINAIEAQMDVIKLKMENLRMVDNDIFFYFENWKRSRESHLEQHEKERKEAKKRLKKYEEELEDLQPELNRHQRNLEKIKKNFDETLVAYNNCIKTCPAKPKEVKKEPKKSACNFPTNRPAIVVGPNSEVGSGAALTKDVKNKAKGMAMGGLLGGSGGGGFSVGGGKAGGFASNMEHKSQKEPKLDDDPTSGKFTELSQGDTELEARAGFTDDGFVVSVNIDDTDGDGTFEAIWIEDGKGKIYLPIRYLLIDIYRDWKLSVWWTYDRWVNGQLVEHRQGDSMTVGRDYLGSISLFEGAKAITNSIWHFLGFETALKGAQHIGAVFNISPSVFDGPCPAQLIIHITQPDKDPVTTIPVVGELFKQSAEPAKATTMILMRPHIVKMQEE